MTDVFIVETKEQYYGDTSPLIVAASLEIAMAFVADVHHMRNQTVGLWKQDGDRWTADVIGNPGDWDTAAYIITRFPVVEAAE
jgi:hypothetical protein